MLIGFGLMGIGMILVTGRPFEELLPALFPALLLFGVNRVTEGGVGEGDAWFFLVTGLFLNVWEVVALLISGLFFCSIFCLSMAVSMGVQRSRYRRVPFLPFLLPVGLWISLL